MKETTIKNALIAEMLGDIGKLHDLIEEINQKTPRMIEEHSLSMRHLLNTWKLEAKVQHQRNLEQELPKYKQEIRQLIYSEISGIVTKNFEYHKDVVQTIVQKQFKKFYVYCFFICILCLGIGVFVGKYLI